MTLSTIKHWLIDFIRKRHGYILIIFLLLVPNFVALFFSYPGFLQADHQASIGWMQAGVPNSWHSVLWTVIAYPFIYLAPTMAFYGIFQILIFSASVVFCIYKLEKLNIIKLKWAGYILALVFALCPTFLLYNNLYSSDVMFATLLIPLTVSIIEIVVTKGKFFGKMSNIILLSSILFLVFELRKNAILIISFLAIILIIKYRMYIKKIFILIGCVVALILAFFCIEKFVIKAVDSPSEQFTSTQEYLSVPLQQIARVYRDGGYIPDDARSFLNTIHSEEEWSLLYNPILADPVKTGVDFSFDLVKYWLVLGRHNTKIYLDAYAELEGSYWQISYPNKGDSLNPEFNLSRLNAFMKLSCLVEKIDLFCST